MTTVLLSLAVAWTAAIVLAIVLARAAGAAAPAAAGRHGLADVPVSRRAADPLAMPAAGSAVRTVGGDRRRHPRRRAEDRLETARRRRGGPRPSDRAAVALARAV